MTFSVNHTAPSPDLFLQRKSLSPGRHPSRDNNGGTSIAGSDRAKSPGSASQASNESNNNNNRRPSSPGAASNGPTEAKKLKKEEVSVRASGFPVSRAERIADVSVFCFLYSF